MKKKNRTEKKKGAARLWREAKSRRKSPIKYTEAINMGIKTEDFAKNIPPKEMTGGIDWIGILDSFDPAVLEDKYINECARRNPFETNYNWEEDGIAPEPIEDRLSSSQAFASFERRDLESCVKRIEKEGL